VQLEAVVGFEKMKKKANSAARLAALVFVVAAFFAASCPVMCAARVCPSDVHQASGHVCEQNPAHHPNQPAHQSGQQQPDRSDCVGHLNPNVFVGTFGDLAATSLDTVGYLRVPVASPNAGVNFVLGTRGADAFECSPPLRSRIAIYQKNSDLRI
jgi:hypothetical protein